MRARGRQVEHNGLTNDNAVALFPSPKTPLRSFLARFDYIGIGNSFRWDSFIDSSPTVAFSDKPTRIGEMLKSILERAARYIPSRLSLNCLEPDSFKRRNQRELMTRAY